MSDPAPPFDPGPADDPGERRVSTPLAILLAVVVGLALLYALWTFVIAPLMAEDEDVADGQAEQADTAPAGTPAPTAPATPGATPTPGDDATPGMEMMMLGQPVPETFEIFTARDPFQQLIVERPAGGAAEDDEESAADDESAEEDADVDVAIDSDVAVVVPPSTSGSGSAGTGTSDADEDTADGDDPTEAPSDDATDDGGDLSSQSTGGEGEFFTPPGTGTTEVTLVGPTTAPGGEPALLVAVDEVEHEVVEGEVFAERFWLLDIDGACATFLFGDSRFTLCEGDSIMK